jgi:hypothetical protein
MGKQERSAMDDFVPETFTVPTTLVGDGFRLTPLGPEHNASDHDAWMSSIDHIRATPGYPDGNWPAHMTAAENRGDLERHRADFERRVGFTYTVLDPDDVVIGCVYIYPSKAPDVDADVRSWVRADRAHLDRAVYEAVSTWLTDDWPFRTIEYAPRAR